MTYPMTIAGLRRELPLCKVADDFYIGAFIMFGDAEITVACAKELLARAPKEYDYLLTAEAKSIPLIHEMARQSGASEYFVARKGMKVYLTNPIHVQVRSITTQHDQDLYLSGEDAAKMKGKKVLIVDDVISTGESLHALEELVHQAGGEVAGRMAVLAEGDAQKREDIARFILSVEDEIVACAASHRPPVNHLFTPFGVVAEKCGRQMLHGMQRLG